MDKRARQIEDSGKRERKKKKKAVYFCYNSATIFFLL